MPYLLDTNVFIQATKLHYGFDFCPAFWDWLVHENAAGKVFSIEKVADELESAGDDLSEWSRTRGAGLFLKPDPALRQAFGTVGTWAAAQQFDPAAVNTFLQVADFYLVSHALARNYTVVSHEKPEPFARKVIKIPDACLGVGVKCMTPFQMLRREKAKFVLGKIV
ncbi:MAG: hypothetical protein FD180_390 [Planctomycetota bacterium]|nr:MAG: hypothetical protein FD180_390 [Planctomycetota bacterium]